VVFSVPEGDGDGVHATFFVFRSDEPCAGPDCGDCVNGAIDSQYLKHQASLPLVSDSIVQIPFDHRSMQTPHLRQLPTNERVIRLVIVRSYARGEIHDEPPRVARAIEQTARR
jgi:hypothetical protein